jgi:hypothetical protein
VEEKVFHLLLTAIENLLIKVEEKKFFLHNFVIAILHVHEWEKLD